MTPEFEAVLAAILDLPDRDALIRAAQQVQYLLELSRLQCPPGQQGAISNLLLIETSTSQRIPSWLLRLAIQLSGYSGGRIIRGQSPPNSLWIVGREAVTKLVRKVYLTLMVKIEALSLQAQPTAQDRPAHAPRQWIRKWRNHWRVNLVRELDLALALGVREAQESLGLYPESSLRWERRTVIRWMAQYLQLVPAQKPRRKK